MGLKDHLKPTPPCMRGSGGEPCSNVSPHSTVFLPNTWLKSPLFQFVAIFPCPVTTIPGAGSLPVLPIGPFRY